MSYGEERESLSRRGFLKLGLAGAAMGALDWRAWAAAEGLPDYYGDYLAKVAARIGALSSVCDDAFFFITDLHFPSNRCVSGRILAKLVAETGVKKVLCGGDIPEAFGGKASIDRAITAYRSEWVEAVERAGGEFYPAKGNHDFTIRDSPSVEDGFTYDGKSARDILMDTCAVRANAIVNKEDPEGCYYYFDSPGTGVRYIVADTTDSICEDRTFWALRHGMCERQLRWLAENALATIPAGWVAVVMHHIPIAEIVSGDSGVQQTFGPWRSLLEAYQSRGVATVGGKKFDFSSAQGRILCSLTGHEHAERQTYRNGLWHITEPCDASYGDYIAGSSPWCTDLPNKVKGTIFEQTFDAVHVDRRNNALHFTRIGGGADRTVRLAPLHLVTGEAMKLDGTAWGCHDADRVRKERNPNNIYQSFLRYYSDVVQISSERGLIAQKPGEAVALGVMADGKRRIVPVVVEAKARCRLRVGSYNIRLSTGDVGTENGWDERRDDLAALIRKLDLDVFGAQEVRPEQAEFLRERLPEFGFVGDHCGADRVSGEASPVFYRKDRFEAEKTGTFWLSETPEVPGVAGWGAACPRVCSYLVLREKATGRRFCFANTHTDHVSAEARERGMLLIIERMKALCNGAPIIFTGDHNCREVDAPAAAVAKVLVNALYESETPPKGPWRTFNGWKWCEAEPSTLDALKETPEARNAPGRGSRIDYIYATRGTRVLDYATIADARPGKRFYPSDHYPVVATVEM